MLIKPAQLNLIYFGSIIHWLLKNVFLKRDKINMSSIHMTEVKVVTLLGVCLYHSCKPTLALR